MTTLTCNPSKPRSTALCPKLHPPFGIVHARSMSEDQQVLREVLTNLLGDKKKDSAKAKDRGLPQSGKSKQSKAKPGSKAVQGQLVLNSRGSKPQKPVTADGRQSKKEGSIRDIEQRYGLLQLQTVSHGIPLQIPAGMPGVKRPAVAFIGTPPERNRPPDGRTSQPGVATAQIAKLTQPQDHAASPASGTPPVPGSQRCCDYGSPMQESPQVTSRHYTSCAPLAMHSSSYGRNGSKELLCR